MKADIVIDLSFGDTGKGKISAHLSKINLYTHVVRFNGSGNAGHTIIYNNKKFVTHQIPAGVFSNIKSIIGPGCVLHPQKFLDEIKYLEDNGLNCRDLIKVAYNTHIITDEHIQNDDKGLNIGTTKSGNGGAYKDKFARTGIRAEKIEELKPYLIDIYEEFYEKIDPYILFEGAQGFGLDIDWGPYYPYLTSSNCIVGAALNNGIPYTAINKVYGVSKVYVTYVGTKKFQPEGEVFNKIQQVGQEFGATTGRKRQVNFLDLDMTIKAVRINGVSNLIFNKLDILKEVNVWKLYHKKELIDLKDENSFINFIKETLTPFVSDVVFSSNPHTI
jgi:adenylosuccinate synthase